LATTGLAAADADGFVEAFGDAAAGDAAGDDAGGLEARAAVAFDGSDPAAPRLRNTTATAAAITTTATPE
jgi:hypothetical protein